MKPNLGYLFWRECYRLGDDKTHIKNTIDRLLRSGDRETGVEAPHGFELTVRYPGLLVGTGYSHGLKLDEDVKTGFYFDPTSGLPAIPGSSIKGVLRSLFGYPMKGKDPYADAKHAMIRDYLNLPDDFDVAKLARAIFEGIDEQDDRIGIYERDIFYDARVVKVSRGLLADDYITPHKDPLKNPVPIRILKVTPGVTFQFAFRLSDTVIGSHKIDAERKEALFLLLLREFGVGAKTNVGYGNFEAPAECREFDLEDCIFYLRKCRETLEKEKKERLAREREEKKEKERFAQLSPLERKLEELRPEKGSSEKFSTRILKELTEGRLDEHRCETLRYLKRVMVEEKSWKPESKAKNPAKDKAHQHTLKIIKMLEECS